MSLVTRQYGPNAKFSKLSFYDMDMNLYYLQELGVSGFSYSNGTINITNPTGGTKSVTINKVTGFTYNNLNSFTITDNYNNNYSATFNTVTGLTVNGVISATTYQNLPPAVFNGGTVSNGTNFIGGLSANTISATTYQNLPIDPDTYVTGFTYSNNTFVIKQNNGQPDISQTINTVTGLTVNGDLNITGNTSAQGLTATTFSSSTVNVANTTGTPNQVASFDITGKLVAGAGQSTSSSFGSSTLTVTNATTTFTVLPGISQTITVPSNCFALITADGGVNTTSTSTTSIASVDIAIFIDGSFPTNGGYRRVSAHNPSGTAINSTGVPWSITTTATLSPGLHTIDVRSVYVTGSSMSVSSNNTNSRQASLYITLIKL